MALCKNESYFPSNSGATGEKSPRLPTSLLYRYNIQRRLRLFYGGACEIYVQYVAHPSRGGGGGGGEGDGDRERERERGEKEKKKKEGNHGTWTHSGIMPTTRVVHAEKNAC